MGMPDVGYWRAGCADWAGCCRWLWWAIRWFMMVCWQWCLLTCGTSAWSCSRPGDGWSTTSSVTWSLVASSTTGCSSGSPCSSLYFWTEFLRDLLGMSLLASTSVLPHEGHLGLLASADLMPKYYFYRVWRFQEGKEMSKRFDIYHIANKRGWTWLCEYPYYVGSKEQSKNKMK